MSDLDIRVTSVDLLGNLRELRRVTEVAILCRDALEPFSFKTWLFPLCALLPLDMISNDEAWNSRYRHIVFSTLAEMLRTGAIVGLFRPISVAG